MNPFYRTIRAAAAQILKPPSKRKGTRRPENLGEVLLPAARTRWLGPRARDLTPDVIETLLRDAVTSRSPRREQELYQLMAETWPRLLKNTGEVKNAVLGLDWNILEPDEDALTAPGARPVDRGLLSRMRNGMRGDPCLGRLGWEDTLRTLLEARFRGVAAVEILWRVAGDAVLPSAGVPLSPWHFGWSTGAQGFHSAPPQPHGGPPRDGRLVLYPDAGQTARAAEFEPGKFLVALHNATGSAHASSGALLRPLAWFWCAANFSREWLLNFAQIFGQPFRWATYAQGDDAAKDALAAAMESMGSAAWGVGPEGSEVNFVESKAGAGDNPQSHVLSLADTACDLLVLGQTLTTDVGDSGSRALGEVHSSVRADVIDAAAAWLAGILNDQLVPHVARLTTGRDDIDPADLPFFEPGRKEQKNLKDLAEVLKIISNDLGAGIGAGWVYETFDIPRPGPGDDILPGAAAPAAPPSLPPGATGDAVRAAVARLPLDAREYLLARLPIE